MKNKKCVITLLVCILLSTALHGMIPSKAGRVLKPTIQPTARPIPTGPEIKPQPKPTEPIKAPKKDIIKLPQPSTTSKPIQLSKPFKPFKSLEPVTKPQLRQDFISPKDQLEDYKTLAKKAQKYNINFKKYNPKTNTFKPIEYNRFIQQIEKKIEQAEDFSKDELINIDTIFNELERAINLKIELKESISTLDNLITTAKEASIKDQDLEKFKPIDINKADDMETIDAFKEATDRQIKELEDLIEKHKAPQQKAVEEQGPRAEDFEEETEQEKIARESREQQKQPQKKGRKKIILPTEIQESSLKEFKEKEQLRLREEAAEQKRAAEQAELEAKKLQKEVDAEYELFEKESAHLEQTEKELNTVEEELRQLKLEQEKTIANKVAQEKLSKNIVEDEAAIESIELKIQEIKKAKEEHLKTIQEKSSALALEIDKEEQAFTAQQEIESARRKQELKEVKTERQRAEREARKAEQKAQEEQQKLDDAVVKNQEAKNVLQKDMQKAKADFAQQKQEIETKAQAELEQLNQDTAKKIQEAKGNLQKSKSFIAKDTAEQIAELEALEKKYQEEATIQQQSIEKIKNEQSARINSKYEQELRLIEADLQQFEQKQAADRIAQEKAREQAQQDIQELEKKIEADEHALQDIQKKQQELLQQKNEAQQDITTNYEQEIKRLDEQLAEAEVQHKQVQERLKAERSKAEERKKEEEKREKERQEREKEIEQRKKEEKIEEGGGDGTISYGANIQQPEPSKIKEPSKEEDIRNKKPHIPTIPPTEIPVTGKPEETESVVLPQTIPDTIPTTQQEAESKPAVIEEPIEQAIKEPVETTTEVPTYYPMGRPSGKTAGRPTPSSPYTPQSQTPSSFMPSASYGGSVPSTVEGIGRTSSDHMDPYTQRIEWQKNFAPREKTASAEINKEKKVQPQDIVWWEKLVPKWIVQYLGRKDRNLPEEPKTEKPTPIEAPEEEKPITKETSIVKTIVETIKKPITNAISYIRGLFYG